MSGRLIVVEGLDGTGKTTMSRSLADVLDACWMSTPGEALGCVRETVDRALDCDPRARQLFYAGSVLAASQQAREKMQRGEDVVMDRYWLTTLVYARQNATSLRLDEVEATLIPADVTLLVHLPEQERRCRLETRGLTAADRQTMVPGVAERINADYRTALRRPVTGAGLMLSVAGLSPNACVAAAIVALQRRLTRIGIGDQGRRSSSMHHLADSQMDLVQ